VTKEIRPRLRSGATANRVAAGPGDTPTASSLADKHAKRLKVAKSSRVTLGATPDGQVKPPRFGARNFEPEVDLTLSNKRDLGSGVNQ